MQIDHIVGNERAVTKRFYLDDYLDSFCSNEEALQITQSVIEINQKAIIDLHHVKLNSKLVTAHYGPYEDFEFTSIKTWMV